MTGNRLNVRFFLFYRNILEHFFSKYATVLCASLLLYHGIHHMMIMHLTGMFADKPVVELNNRNNVCCDQGTHPYKMLIKPCENFWYVCGFNSKHHSVAEHDELNKRLLPYDFIRLARGRILFLWLVQNMLECVAQRRNLHLHLRRALFANHHPK